MKKRDFDKAREIAAMEGVTSDVLAMALMRRAQGMHKFVLSILFPDMAKQLDEGRPDDRQDEWNRMATAMDEMRSALEMVHSHISDGGGRTPLAEDVMRTRYMAMVESAQELPGTLEGDCVRTLLGAASLLLAVGEADEDSRASVFAAAVSQARVIVASRE